MADNPVKDKHVAIGELHEVQAFLELLKLTDNGRGGAEACHMAYVLGVVLDHVMPKIAAVRNWIDMAAIDREPAARVRAVPPAA